MNRQPNGIDTHTQRPTTIRTHSRTQHKFIGSLSIADNKWCETILLFLATTSIRNKCVHHLLLPLRLLGWTSSNVGCARLNDKCQQICEMAKGNCVNMWVECRLIYCECVHFYVFDVGSRSQSMLHVEDTTFHLIKFGNVLEIETLEPNQKKKYSFILMRHFIYLLP